MAKHSNVGANKSPLKLGEQSASSHISILAPVPSRPANKSPLKLGEPASPLQLEQILKLLGNDRSYTLIRSHPNTWKVHFAGDHTASVIKLVNGKPVITKEDD